MAETNYEFLDCGGGRRLERIGEVLIDRPAPQADFPRKLPEELWSRARARFVRGDRGGRWVFPAGEPAAPSFRREEIRMELRFSENGQIGLYPEQLENWLWLRESCAALPRPLRVLNGFAYTGGSSLFAAAGGGAEAEIRHVDASKSAVNWARRNRELSFPEGGEAVRFVVEDILLFMEREIKRGRSYQGLILDPPAFGRAPGRKTWRLKRDLPLLREKSRLLMGGEAQFLLLSCHDPELSREDLADFLGGIAGVKRREIETLALSLPAREGNDLPNGIAARWRRKS